MKYFKQNFILNVIAKIMQNSVLLCSMQATDYKRDFLG